MGCPAMDMIQDDVRERLLEMDGIDVVEIEVVWPTWSKDDIAPWAGSSSRTWGWSDAPCRELLVFTARVGEEHPLRHNGNVGLRSRGTPPSTRT